MKSLKQICESSLTHPLYEVSILADVDDQINAYDNSIIDRIDKWIKENYDCMGLKISDNPNKDGLYEVTAQKVIVKNKSITSLTNGMFEWIKAKYFSCSSCPLLTSLMGAPQEVGGDFDCSDCKSLKTLVGAPQEVGGEVYCHQCTTLKSLEGSPKKVGRNFTCSYCPSLKSLKGAPQEINDFYCSFCSSLESLEGAPKEVGKDFYCLRCNSLKSLKGAPEKVGGNFYCYDCKTKFTVDDIRKVSNVKGKIFIK